VLLENGVAVPGDLQVVSHCNFPATGRLRLPIQRIGVDIRDLLAQAVASLRAIRVGGEAPAFRRLPAIFEQEYQARWNPRSHATRAAARQPALT
jgi:DNA-binding LacI/PurR family transcriptional regulator